MIADEEKGVIMSEAGHCSYSRAMKRVIPFATLTLAFGCSSPSTQSEPSASASSSASAGGEQALASVRGGSVQALEAVVAGEHRSPENKARDVYRHPVETLTFFGLEPDMHVLEIRPGGGWYTEILAPYLREAGKLTVGVPSAEGRRAKYRERFMEMKAARPEVFSEVNVVTFDPPAPIELGPDASLDMVLTFRNTHNWISDGGEKEAYAAFFDVLRPGGVLGVVQHRAEAGSDAAVTAKTGYVPEAYVIQVAEAAGFELVGRSDINRNPMDTHDHPEGVWTLPPVLRLGTTDQARYHEFGESDRMTLKFRKPAAP